MSDDEPTCPSCGCSIFDLKREETRKIFRRRLRTPVIVGSCLIAFALAYLIFIILTAKNYSTFMVVSFSVVDALVFAFGIAMVVIFGKKLRNFRK